MFDKLKQYWGLVVAVVVVLNTLLAGYLTLAIEKRPVDLPGLVFVVPDKEVVASLPYSEKSGTGFLAVGLMATSAAGLGYLAIRRRPSELPAEAQGIPGVVGKIALNLAIRYLEVRAPKTPGDLDDNILELLKAIQDSNILDLLAIKEQLVKLKEARATGQPIK